MRNRFLWITLLSLGLVPVSVFAQNRETRAEKAEARERREAKEDDGKRVRDIEFSDLPKSIREQVRENAKGAKIVDVNKVTMGDRVVYQVYAQEGPKSVVWKFDEKGKFLDTSNVTEEGRSAVKFNELPGPVQQTLKEQSRGKRELEGVQQVTRNNKTWYVATIQMPNGDDKVVRVGRSGEVLASTDADRDPKLLSDRDDRRTAQRRSERLDDEHPTLKGWQSARADYNSFPGEVKQAIGREARQDKVTAAAKLTKGNQTLYRAEIEGAGRSRTVTVTENGKIVDLDNTTDPGRDSVSYNELPGEVKSTLAKEAGNINDIRSITQVTRGSETYYVARIDDGANDRTVRVGKNGDVLSEKDIPRGK